ncbi:unnamed protein product, partial [Rotaria socialis]
QPVRQTAATQHSSSTTEGQRPEGKSYAGIAKLHSLTGPSITANSTTTTAPRVVPSPSAVP